MQRTPLLVDLHAHTTCSDGSDTPAQVLALAAAQGISLLAVADHNSIEGARQALAAAACLRASGDASVPHVVAAAEFDVDCATGSLHLLTYGLNLDAPPLRALADRAEAVMLARNEETLANLIRAGYPLREHIPDGLNGPQLHVATRTALLAGGYAAGREEVYARFLWNPTFVPPSPRPRAEEVFEAAHAAGALVSLAHPCKLEIDDEATVAALAALGLWGMEVYYGDGGEAYAPRAQALAARHRLLPTIGSDYHGIYRAPRLGMQVPPQDSKLREALCILAEKGDGGGEDTGLRPDPPAF